MCGSAEPLVVVRQNRASPVPMSEHLIQRATQGNQASCALLPSHLGIDEVEDR